MAANKRTASRLLAALLAGSAALIGCGDSAAERAADSAPEVSPLTRDGRLDYLLAPCAKSSHFNVNTADLPALLGYTLLHGGRDALRRCKRELAELGPEGIEVAHRIARTYWNQPDKKAHVRNAIDVALLSDEPAARELLLEAVAHPMEDLRLLAAEGLGRFEEPQDWEALRAALDGASVVYFPRVVGYLYILDQARTAEIVLGWVETDQFQTFWDDLLPRLAELQVPELVERCGALWPVLPVGYAVWPAAACARAGDPEALETLRGWTHSEDATVRSKALLACGYAELFDELASCLRSDPSADNRMLIASLLSTPPERIERNREALFLGSSDMDQKVATTCLRALADHGDAAAVERGFQLLAEEGGGGIRTGLTVLGESLWSSPQLAQRAQDVLLAELEEQAHRSLSERAVLLVSLGRLPLPSSAEFLLAEADAQSGEQLQSLRAAHWFTLQAGNVGESAHALLLERFARETDPVRRIDYLEALTLRGGEAARDRLLELIDGDQLSPYELLYAAERLVRIGPTEVVAPAIKRATLRVDQDDARRALQCLLWQAFPGPEPEPIRPR